VFAFDQHLRSMLAANLAAHDRREQRLEGRRHAAVAIVLVDSDAARDDDDPLPPMDLSMVPGEARDERGQPLDGRMIGVAGGAALLLCRRPATMRRHAGQWAFPGGRLDAGETALDAALRELDEELGLRLGPDRVVGWLDDYATRSGFVITPIVVWGGDRPALEPNPDEVQAVYRIGLQALDAAEPRLIATAESNRPILQIPLGNDLIHAPTGAMLLQFRQVALRGRSGERVDGYEEPLFARQ
jgi:8-oxo-dGTP pyrophosphatase MutT (NUDIX family)